MMKEKQLIITLKGDKVQLHKQLKQFCLDADKTMNGTVIELIKKHLNKNKKLNNLIDNLIIKGQTGTEEYKRLIRLHSKLTHQ